MRKMVSLILVMVMLLTLAVPGVAATIFPAGQVLDPCRNCDHNFNVYSNGPQPGKGIYVNNDGCRKYIATGYCCTRCGYCYNTYEYAQQPTAHSGSAYSASCNGTTQTIVRNCVYCGRDYTTTQRCPMATHSGECQWLPC